MTTDAERREATDAWAIQLREQQLRDIRAQLAAVTAERDAAVSALAMATMPGGNSGVWMHMDKYTEHLADIERYGADQWRRGNAGRDPQEFEEWRRE